MASSLSANQRATLNDDVYVREWRPAVTVGVDSLQGSTSFEEYVSERIDNLAFSATNINSNETITGGSPAYKVDSFHPGGEIRKLSIYIMNNEGRIYDIDYSAHEASFDTYLPIVQKMIDSFKINSITSESQSNAAQGQEPEVSLQNSSAPEQDSMAQSELTMDEIMVEEEPSLGLEVVDNIKRGNQSQPMQWLTHNDPILQFSIEYPSTWDIRQDEDIVSFEIPDTYSDFDVIVEPLLTVDHSEYARDTLNERRKYSLEIVGLNDTSINGQPATMAQYDSAGTMTLSYFMVTDDYTGYRLLYAPDFRDDNSTQRMPMIERMVNSFRITK